MKLNNLNSFSAPSRRSVVKAAAWTAPVAVVATAAPAFATSPGNPTELDASIQSRTSWDGLITSGLNTGVSPNRYFLNSPTTRVPSGGYACYNVSGADDGSFFTTVTLTVTWGNWDQPMLLNVGDTSGWTVAGDPTAASGTLVLTRSLFNGVTQEVSLPEFVMTAVGAEPTTGSLSAVLIGDFVIGSVQGSTSR